DADWAQVAAGSTMVNTVVESMPGTASTIKDVVVLLLMGLIVGRSASPLAPPPLVICMKRPRKLAAVQLTADVGWFTWVVLVPLPAVPELGPVVSVAAANGIIMATSPLPAKPSKLN